MPGRYFEQFVVGDEFVSPSRTITETDIVMFAAMTGDYNELHTNEEFMKKSQFGRRIGHGLLGLAISHGLLFRSGILEGTVIAFLDVESWRFLAPFFMGDTLHVNTKVSETKASKSKSDRGVVKLYLELVNQNGNVIQSGHKTLLMKRRSTGESE